jgi:hypothetical protein
MIPGMTMQDWLAGQIIAAMLGSDPANCNQRDVNGRLCGIEPMRMANMAKIAYQAAEAMMQARSQQSNTPQAVAAARQPVR